MKFYKNIIRTFNDLPNHSSLLIHSLIGCNLKCFGCHNYSEIVAKKHPNYYTEAEILKQIAQNGFMFDAVIFSGGEFLIEDLKSLERFLNNLRELFSGHIIINTNGTYPEKIEYLLNHKLVSGFHIDMKLPYHLLDPIKDQDIYQAILGVRLNKRLQEKILTSIEIVVKDNSPYSQIRTVKYPLLTNEFFRETQEYLYHLNLSYHSQVPYHLNDFTYIDSAS